MTGLLPKERSFDGPAAVRDDAAAAGADCFISGEISERTTHLARELGIAYLACGHHATERFGIEALGRRLADEYSLEVEFIDIDNPV